jgi:hypothetical protein
MTQGVQDLIKAINSGDSSEIDSVFQAEMANRISTKLEDLRVSVAQNMFATEQAIEETEVEEDELTLEDYSVEEIEEFMQTEDFEQLDELSKKTIGSYAHKATDDAQDKAHDAYDSYKASKTTKMGGAQHKVSNRLQGLERASKKLGDKSISKSAEKSVDQHIKQRTAYDNMDDRKAATHDYHAMKNSEKAHDKIQKASGVKEETEDFEQLDELSKKTLGSYINRAVGNTGKGKGQDWPHDNNLNYAAQSYGTEKDDDDEPGDEDSPAANTVSKRLRGIKMAVNKLTKKAGKK